MKKRMALLLSVLLLCLAGCGPKTAAPDVSSAPDSSVPAVGEIYYDDANKIALYPYEGTDTSWFYETIDPKYLLLSTDAMYAYNKSQYSIEEANAWVQQQVPQNGEMFAKMVYEACPISLLCRYMRLTDEDLDAYIAAETQRINADCSEQEKIAFSQQEHIYIYNEDLNNMASDYALSDQGKIYSAYWLLNVSVEAMQQADVSLMDLEKKVKLYVQKVKDMPKYVQLFEQKLQDYIALLRTDKAMYVNDQGYYDLHFTDDDSNDWFYETLDRKPFVYNFSLDDLKKHMDAQVLEAWSKQQTVTTNCTFDFVLPRNIRVVEELSVPKSVYEAAVKDANEWLQTVHTFDEATNTRQQRISKYTRTAYLLTQEHIDAIYSGDCKTMSQVLQGEHGVYGNGRLYNAYWVLNHGPEDYRQAGISVQDLEEKVGNYSYILFAKGEGQYIYAFYQKLQDYKALME